MEANEHVEQVAAPSVPNGNPDKMSALQIAALATMVAMMLGMVVVAASYMNNRSQDEPDPKAASTAPMEAEGKKFIADQMRDPDAALFREVYYANGCVHGEVNGKNAYGGYVGYTDFYYNTATKKGAIKPSENPMALAGSKADLDVFVAKTKFLADSMGCGASTVPLR